MEGRMYRIMGFNSNVVFNKPEIALIIIFRPIGTSLLSSRSINRPFTWRVKIK